MHSVAVAYFKIMEKNQPLIQLEDVTKVYHMGDVDVHALRGVSLQVKEGESVAIMGASVMAP